MQEQLLNFLLNPLDNCLDNLKKILYTPLLVKLQFRVLFMVQIVPARPTFLQGLLQGFSENLPDAMAAYSNKKNLSQENEALKRLGIGDLRGVSNPRIRELLLQGHQKKELAEIPKPTPEITPYQSELIKQRQSQLGMQEQRLEQAREKGRKQLPQMIANYTKSYAKDLGLKPDEKLELDQLVNSAYIDNKMDLNEALSTAVEKYAQKKEAFETLTQQLPPRPFGADFRQETKNQALQQTAVGLKQAFDSGIITKKQIVETLKDKGWKKEEIDRIVNFIEGQEEEQQSPQESELQKFDSKNPQHVARARQILNQTGGDRSKANAILSQEFSR